MSMTGDDKCRASGLGACMHIPTAMRLCKLPNKLGERIVRYRVTRSKNVNAVRTEGLVQTRRQIIMTVAHACY